MLDIAFKNFLIIRTVYRRVWVLKKVEKVAFTKFGCCFYSVVKKRQALNEISLLCWLSWNKRV